MADRRLNDGRLVLNKFGSGSDHRLIGEFSTEHSPDSVAVQMDQLRKRARICPPAALTIEPTSQHHGASTQKLADLRKGVTPNIPKQKDVSIVHRSQLGAKEDAVGDQDVNKTWWEVTELQHVERIDRQGLSPTSGALIKVARCVETNHILNYLPQ